MRNVWQLLIPMSLLLTSTPPMAHANADREARTRAQYRLGDDADKDARRKAADQHRADFSTPQGALEAWRAAAIRGNRGDFLECLTPALRALKYPRGIEARIKYVDSKKYQYLLMYATLGEAEPDGDRAHIDVRVSFKRASGGLRTQVLRFTLHRLDNKWRLGDLGRKVRRSKP